MNLFEQLGKINRNLSQAYKARAAGRHLSPVRRIERVAPPKDRRVVAITFEDGPNTATTGAILKALEAHGARGTFAVIGSTADNYPDTEGAAGTPLWNGVKFDHYPGYGRDADAGAVTQGDLVRRIVAGGHELANHSYSHIAFGRSGGVAGGAYAGRMYLASSRHVLEDLHRLHDLIEESFGYEMRLGRPPHYVDRTPDDKDVYQLYSEMDYNYLAASFNAAGFNPDTSAQAPSVDYSATVAAMAAAVEEALKVEDGDASLNGQIISLQDGYNWSKQSPVVDALPMQLEALRRAGYEVVTVSELLEMSPFADLEPDDECQEAVRGLLAAGHVMGFKNNTFLPDRDLTLGEMAVMLLPRHTWRESALQRASAAAAREQEAATRRRGGLGGRAGSDRSSDLWDEADRQRGLFGFGPAGGGPTGGAGGSVSTSARTGDVRLRDVRPGHPYYEAIQAVLSAGLKVPAGMYKPDLFASRQYAREAIAVITGREPARQRDRGGMTRRRFAMELWEAYKNR